MTQNRPIKFRAYIKNINKMVEVNEINWDEKGNISSIGYPSQTKYVNHYLEFDPNNVILMQYTGFCDKNGKEIYESDIIECNNSVFYIVTNLVKGMPYIKYAVIGNVYENPELLED